METYKIEILGMTCSGCADTVTKYLKNNDCQDVHVNLALGEGQFSTETPITEKLLQGLKKLGYPSHIQGEGKAAAFHFGITTKFWLSLVFTLPLVMHMFLPKNSFLHQPLVQLILATPVYVLGLIHFGRSAWEALKIKTANMDLLIFTGSSAAYLYSLFGWLMHLDTGHYHNYLFFETSASIVCLVLLGNLIEHKSIQKTTTAIKALQKLQVEFATLISLQMGKEVLSKIPFKDIKKSMLLQVNQGDKIPIDGIITTGSGQIDASMITGESLPVEVKAGDTVIGGTLLTNGNIQMQVSTNQSDSVLQNIINLVKTAQQNKPKIQKIGDKVSAYFTPIVMLIAVITLVGNLFFLELDFSDSMMRAIAVLVIACPCAMGLATPTAIMVGIGRGAKKGIFIKGGDTLEKLAKTNVVFFDKTGTLTTGNFTIKNFTLYNNHVEKIVKSHIYQMESKTSHPIAQSLSKALIDYAGENLLKEIIEEKGVGMRALDNENRQWELGSFRILNTIPKTTHDLYLCCQGELAAGIDIEDEIKHGVSQVVQQLNQMNIQSIMLSGDTHAKCNAIAKTVGITKVYSQQTPENKLHIIHQYKNDQTLMVGDGINDGPALAAANCSMSFSKASEVAKNGAQVILSSSEDVFKIIDAIAISQLTLKTIKQNLFWALFYNVLAIPIAAIGLLSPMIAAGSMAFSDVVVIGNSLRMRWNK